MTGMPNHSETDLTGFDELWQVGYEETKDFIRSKNTAQDKRSQEEIDLLQKEVNEKVFDIQKLEWQLNEREKELKILYDELHRVLELNKKLDQQLEDYEKLCSKQQGLLDLSNLTNQKEPDLPSFS